MGRIIPYIIENKTCFKTPTKLITGYSRHFISSLPQELHFVFMNWALLAHAQAAQAAQTAQGQLFKPGSTTAGWTLGVLNLWKPMASHGTREIHWAGLRDFLKRKPRLLPCRIKVPVVFTAVRFWDSCEWRTKLLYLFILMPCASLGRPLSVVRISAFTDFEATHAKQGYRYRVVPYQYWLS